MPLLTAPLPVSTYIVNAEHQRYGHSLSYNIKIKEQIRVQELQTETTDNK